MATYFWVGGTGTWDNSTTTHWASSSGGAGGAGVPAIADTVGFDSNSGTGTVTVSNSVIPVCQSLAFDGSVAGSSGTYSGTFSISSQLKVGNTSGSVCNFTSGMTLTVLSGSLINFVGTTTTLKTAGLSMPSLNIAVSTSGSVTFQDAFTSSANSNTVTLVTGTLNTNGQTCSWGAFSGAGSTARTLTMGTSAITVTNANGSVWTTSGSNLTMTANTATITLNGNGADFSGSSVNYNGASLSMTGTGTMATYGTFTMTNFTYNPPSGATRILQASAFTVATSLTLTGNAAPNRILVQSATLGTPVSITCNGTVTASYVDFMDITGAGTASWDLHAITGGAGDCQGNSGITFTTSTAQTWSGTSGGNWSANAWSSRVPLPQDDVTISSAFSASQTVTVDCSRMGRSVIWTGVSGSPVWKWNLSVTMFGSLTMASGMGTMNSGGNNLILSGRSSYTITCAGISIPGGGSNVQIIAPGGTYISQDTWTMAAGFYVNYGTYNANNFNVTAFAFSSSQSTTRVVQMGTGTWTLTGTGSTVWNTATTTNLTLTVSTATVSFTAAPGSLTTAGIVTGGVTMPNLTVAGGSNLTVQFSDAFTTAGTVTLTSGTLNTNNQTCSIGIMAFSGSTTRTLTLGTSTITLTGGAFTVWNGGTTTNLTFSGASSTLVFSVAGCTASFGSLTYGTITINSTGMFSQIGAITVATLAYAPTSGTSNIYNVETSFTVSTALTLTGAAAPNRIIIQSNVVGTARTITCNGTVTASYVDFMDITGAGSASWDLHAIPGGAGDCQGNSGITFTSPRTLYWTGGTGSWSDTGAVHWSTSTGGSTGLAYGPLPQDTANLDANSFTSGNKTLTMDTPRICANLLCSGAPAGAVFTGSVQGTVFGNVNLTSMTRSGWSQGFQFAGRGSQTITTGGFGNVMPGCSVNAFGGIYTLQDSWTSSSQPLFLTQGTLTTNNQAVQVSSFGVTNNSATITLNLGSSTLTLVGSGVAWNIGPTITNFTLNAGTSTIVVSDTTSTSKTFAGVGLAYSTLQITPGGTGAVIISGSNTFASLVCTGGSKTITLTSGTTQTITKYLNLLGSPSNSITLNASTSGSAATLSANSSVIVDCNYLSLKDSTAGGGATFYEGVNSSIVSNVSGWTANSYSVANQHLNA